MSDQQPPEEPIQPSVPAFPPAPGSEPPSGARAPTPASEPRRNRGAIVAIVVAVVLVVACSGGALAYFKMRGGPSTVLDKLPAGADVAFIAHLDPAAAQKANLFRLTEKFPDLGSREELTQRFDEMVDQALGGTSVSHEDLDWIGGEAGGYADVGAGTPSFALVVATDDEGAAAETLQRIQEQDSASSGPGSTTTISDVPVSVGSDGSAAAVFDGVAVLASDENAIRSVIDTANGASSIEDEPTFRGVMDRLPEDNLGFMFVNIHELVSMLSSIPAGVLPSMPSTAELDAAQGAGIAVTAQSDSLAIDSVVTTDPSKLTSEQRDALAAGARPNELLGLTPANAFAVFAATGTATSGISTSPQGLGDQLDQIGELDPSAARTIRRLHLQQLLGHLTGDVAVEVGHGSGLLPIGATVMLGIDDPGAVSGWLDRYLPGLLQEAELSSGTKIELNSGDHDGVKITSIQGAPPAEVSWAVLDKAVVIGLTPGDVGDAIDLSRGKGDPITSDPGFSSATAEVPGTSNVVYVDVQAVLSVLKTFLPPDAYQQFLDAGGRDVEPIDVIVAGGTTDENGSTARVLIRVP